MRKTLEDLKWTIYRAWLARTTVLRVLRDDCCFWHWINMCKMRNQIRTRLHTLMFCHLRDFESVESVEYSGCKSEMCVAKFDFVMQVELQYGHFTFFLLLLWTFWWFTKFLMLAKRFTQYLHFLPSSPFSPGNNNDS